MSQEEWNMMLMKGKHHSVTPAVQVPISLPADIFHLFKPLKVNSYLLN